MQIPQFILEHCTNAGKACRIICIQPRRISAVSVSERVAAERDEKIGQSVGYQIRLESRYVLHCCTNNFVILKLEHLWKHETWCKRRLLFSLDVVPCGLVDMGSVSEEYTACIPMFFYSEDSSSMFLRNIKTHLPNNRPSHPKRQSAVLSVLWDSPVSVL